MFGCELHPTSTGEHVEKLEPLCTAGGNNAASVEISTGRPHFIVLPSLHFCGFFWGGYYYFLFLQIEGLWQLCIVR